MYPFKGVKSVMKNKRNDRGFTLIELLIVMIILGLLAALVAPRMFSKIGTSKQGAAKAQISLFETALDTYRLDMGKFPTTEQGLVVLREKPDDGDDWDGPYLAKEIPVDPWGEPFVYKFPSEHSDYEIISYGADKQPGGDDEDVDIVNWKNTK
jgi:general secretion pathway protein G